MPPANGKTTRISDAAFADVVAQAKTYSQVSDLLGVSRGGTTLLAIKRRIERLQLGIEHFQPSRNPRKPLPEAKKSRRATVLTILDVDFIEIIRQVRSFNQLARALGMANCHAHFTTAVRRRAADLGVDLSHFDYVKPSKENGELFRRKTESLLIRNAKPQYSKAAMRKRLLADGLLEDKCVHCGTGPEWIGQPMELALHCKNLDSADMRLENLEIVCWNCRFVLTYKLLAERGRSAAIVKRENFRRKKFMELANEK